MRRPPHGVSMASASEMPHTRAMTHAMASEYGNRRDALAVLRRARPQVVERRRFVVKDVAHACDLGERSVALWHNAGGELVAPLLAPRRRLPLRRVWVLVEQQYAVQEAGYVNGPKEASSGNGARTRGAGGGREGAGGSMHPTPGPR